MTAKGIRQAARRDALEAMVRRRRDIERLEHQRAQATVAILTALKERSAHIETLDIRAGEVINDLLATGLTIGEVVTSWCGDHLTAKEAGRLSRLARTHPTNGPG